MRIFMTGASGFVGSAVARELIWSGHAVTGLARSDAAAQKLEAAGVVVQRGTLEDHDILRTGADACDAVLHLGFSHDFSRFQESCDNERQVIAAFAEAYKGSARSIIVTSGVAFAAKLDEDTPPPATSHNPRIATEQSAAKALDAGIDVRVVRLPIVHGDNDPGFLKMLIDLAKQKGKSAYIGEGSNHWPAGHVLDAARVYTLGLFKGKAGDRYHPASESGVAFRAIAEVIGQRLDLPVVSLKPDEIEAHFTWFSHFAQLDCVASSDKTRDRLGWAPTMPGLVADLSSSATYFAA